MTIFEQLAPYRKAVVALIVGVLQVVALYITLNADGKLSPEDNNALIASIIVALGGTGAVYQVRNEEDL